MDIKKMISFALAAIISSFVPMAVCAEDYSADVSDAKPSNNWGQSIMIYTPYASMAYDTSGNFDPMLLTEDSEVVVGFELSATPEKLNGSPVELIWQTWEVDGKLLPGVSKGWNQVQPYEFDDTHAVFSYKDIVSVYGTDDFTSVFCIGIGDRLGGHNSPEVTVTSLTFTNIKGSEDETSEAEISETTVSVTEIVRVETTRASVTTAATTIQDDSGDGGFVSNMIFLALGCVGGFLVIVVVVLIVLFRKKNSYKG